MLDGFQIASYKLTTQLFYDMLCARLIYIKLIIYISVSLNL